MDNYKALIARLAEIGHINKTLAVLGWDQQCYMRTSSRSWAN
jgi:Zn-dependent M32 family carboxypeptidase